MSSPRAKRPPKHRGWAQVAIPRAVRGPTVLDVGCWYRDGVIVCSALTLAELATGGVGPHWHVSVANVDGSRASDEIVRRVLRTFDMAGAEESPVEASTSRHFWRACEGA